LSSTGADINGNKTCQKTEPLSDGVVLLNPAIEANEIIKLKEIIPEVKPCFDANQVKLMHILSSEGDTATRGIFPIAQWLDMKLFWNEIDKIKGGRLEHNELELDTTTVGNYKPIHTGYITNDTKSKDPLAWNYCSYKKTENLDNPKYCKKKDNIESYPIQAYEPLAIIATDEYFISDYNDVFNKNVKGYL